MAKRDSHNSSLESPEVKNMMANVLSALKASADNADTKQTEEKIAKKISSSIDKGIQQGVKSAKKQTIDLGEKIEIKSNDATYKKQLEDLVQKRARIIEEAYQKSEKALQQHINEEIARNKEEIAKVNKERQDSFKKAINRTKPKTVSVTKNGERQQIDFVEYYQQKIDKDEITLSDNYILQQKRAIKKRIEEMNKATYSSLMQETMESRKKALENELQGLEKTSLILDRELSVEEIKKIKTRITKNKNKLINGLIEEAQTLLDAATSNKEENDKAEYLLRLIEEQEVFYGQKGEILPKGLTKLKTALQGQYKKVNPKLLQESRVGAQWSIDNVLTGKDSDVTNATKQIDKEIKASIKQRINNLSSSIGQQISQADYDEISAILSDTIDSAVKVGMEDFAQGLAKSIQKQLDNAQIISNDSLASQPPKRIQTNLESSEIDKQIEAKREMIKLLKDSVELESKDNQAAESYTAEIQKQEAELEGLLELQKSISKTTDSNINISSGIDTAIEQQNKLQQELDETPDSNEDIKRRTEALVEEEQQAKKTKVAEEELAKTNAESKTPSAKALTERINSRIRKNAGFELSVDEYAKIARSISETIELMERLGYKTDSVKAKFEKFAKSVTVTADNNIAELSDEIKIQEKVNDQLKEVSHPSSSTTNTNRETAKTVEQMNNLAKATEKVADSGEKTAEKIANAKDEIVKEGEAAEKAAKKKRKFADANKQVAESGEQTAKSTKKAAEGVRLEGSELEKERAEFERIMKSGKLLGTQHTYDIDSNRNQYSHERSFTTETTLGRTLKQSLIPERDDSGNLTGEFTIAYQQATNYAKIVKEAVTATLDLQKARHNLLLEDQKQIPNQDNLNSFILQITDAQRRLDEATDSARQFAQEISIFYNDPAYGSKYVMPMFNQQVAEQSSYKSNSEDVRYNNAIDKANEKARKDAESAIDSIQRLNNYLSTTREYVDNIQATYDKSIDPNLKRAVTNTQDLAELERQRKNILAEIVKLENSDPATANLQPLRNMLTQYQRDVRIKQNKGRSQIKDSDLPTYIQKEDNVLTDLIAKSKIYGNASQYVTSELEKQLQILRAGALSSDEFYDVQDVRKYYQAVLEGIQRTQNQDYTHKIDARKRGQSLVDWWNLSGSNKNLTDNVRNKAIDEISKIQSVLSKWESIDVGTNGIDIISDQELTDMKDAIKYMIELRKQYSLPSNKSANQNSIFKSLSQVNKMLSENTKRSFKNTGVYQDLLDLQDRLLHFDTSNAQEEVDKLSTELLELKSRFEGLSNEVKGKGFFQELADAAGTRTRQFIAQWFSFYDILRYSRQAFDTIRELDTALVDLRKTTTMSVSELNAFYYEANDVAKQLGVTTAEVIQQSASWSRLGYSTKEAATGLAQLSSQFASISPGMDTETAQSGLVSIMKAWDIDVNDVQRSIMDNINTLGNNFAETNEDIVNGMQRSAAALSAVGTTYQDAFALFTGGK